MRVGSLVFATDQGLGILAKSFVDNGIVTDVMVVRHGRHVTHDHWYPGARQIANLNDPQTQLDIRTFISEMDVMLFFETPYRWEFIDECRRRNTKTALMVMHECLHQSAWQHMPDLFLCPSLLDLQVIEHRANNYKDMTAYAKRQFLPVPVDYPWRQRERARVFVHNAGHGGLKGRNGTREVVESVQYLKSEAEIVIRSQDPNFAVDKSPWRGITFSCGTVPYERLFADGDVFLFPERHNGLSLPLQEARAAGMLVMCGDRFPMNNWLPTEPLIKVSSYEITKIGPPYQEFQSARFDPRDIAAKIDEFYDTDISQYSLDGKEWAASNSWKKLKPIYMETLSGLCTGRS